MTSGNGDLSAPNGSFSHFVGELRAAFGNFGLERDKDLLQLQFSEVRAALPLLIFSHMFAIAIQTSLVFARADFEQLTIWLVLGTALSLLMVAGYIGFGRLSQKSGLLFRLFRLLPVLASLLSLYWGWSMLAFDQYETVAGQSLMDLARVELFLVGLLTTLRLPGTAIQFILAPIVILAIRISQQTETDGSTWLSSLLLPMTTVALIMSVVFLNDRFRRRMTLDMASKRDGDVIKFLLNDFGAESKDWMWEHNGAGVLTYHSPQLLRVLKEPRETLLGLNLGQEFFQRFAPDLAARMQHREVISEANLSTEIGGQMLHWQISAKPLFDESGIFSGYRGVARDVTAHRNQELALSHAHSEIQKAYDAKSQFLAVISHELRTPINAIVGFSDVLSNAQGEELPLESRREYLGTIRESAKHLQGLINDVLDATRMERGKIVLDIQPLDAAELIEVTTKIVRDHASQNNVSIVARVVDDVRLNGDLTRLRQVLLNIFTNAIKFSPDGGIVHVEMQRPSGSGLAIVVRDAGIGISDEDAIRVFEPFVQVDNGSNRRFGGMGLGLAIARRIARLHGGDLSLKGQKGFGTEARFTLPASCVRWPEAKRKVAAA